MAQQDPCWINLQSLLESTVLYFPLRTSSANIVSVSAAELKSCRRSPIIFILVCFVLQGNLLLDF